MTTMKDATKIVPMHFFTNLVSLNVDSMGLITTRSLKAEVKIDKLDDKIVNHKTHPKAKKQTNEDFHLSWKIMKFLPCKILPSTTHERYPTYKAFVKHANTMARLKLLLVLCLIICSKIEKVFTPEIKSAVEIAATLIGMFGIRPAQFTYHGIVDKHLDFVDAKQQIW